MAELPPSGQTNGIDLIPQDCSSILVLGDRVDSVVEVLRGRGYPVVDSSSRGEDQYACVFIPRFDSHQFADLEKSHEVLQQEGMLVLGFENARFFPRIEERLETWENGSDTPGDCGDFLLDEIRALLTDAGFEIEKISGEVDPKCLEARLGPRRTLRGDRLEIANVSESDLRDFFTGKYRLLARPVFSILDPARWHIRWEKYKTAFRKLSVAEAGLSDEEEKTAFGVLKACCCFRLGKNEIAAGFLNEAGSLDSISTADLKMAAEVFLGLKNLKRALETYRVLVERQPDDISSRLGLARTLIETGEEDPLHDIQEILETDFQNQEALLLLVDRCMKKNNPRGAIPALEKVLDFSPGNLEVQLQLGDLYIVVGEFDKARERAETVLVFDPNNEKALQLKQQATSKAKVQNDPV